MTESTDTTPVEETPQQTAKARIFTKQNLKRGAIAGVVVGGALWLKKQLNASGSVSADVHVATDESNN